MLLKTNLNSISFLQPTESYPSSHTSHLSIQPFQDEDCFSDVPASVKSDSVEFPILGIIKEGNKDAISFD